MTSFRDLLASRMAPFYVGDTGRTERIHGLLVSGNYFSALGLSPALGRFIQPEEAARPGSEPVIVISYEFWQTRFGGSPGVLGQSIRVNERPLTIVGVAPRRFQGTILGLNFSFWTPATMAPLLLAGSPELEDRSLRSYSALGRLAPHATRAGAHAELDRAMRRLAQLYPETNAKIQGEVMPFWMAPHGPQRLLAKSLAILQGIMLLLLLAVCGNAANLMLARTSTRQREIGVRLAIRRRTRTGGQTAAHRKSALSVPRRRAGMGDRHLGYRGATGSADDRRCSDQVSDARGWARPRLLHAAGAGVRFDLRRIAGGRARSTESAVRASRGFRTGLPQQASKYTHGNSSRPWADGPGGGGAALSKLPRDSEYRSGVSAGRRVAGRLRPDRTRRRRLFHSHLYGPVTGAPARFASGGRSGHCVLRATGYSRHADDAFHAGGPCAQRCSSGSDLDQHGYGGLFRN